MEEQALQTSCKSTSRDIVGRKNAPALRFLPEKQLCRVSCVLLLFLCAAGRLSG